MKTYYFIVINVVLYTFIKLIKKNNLLDFLN